MKLHCITAVALSVATVASTASAQDANRWEGFYGGLTYSTGSADQEYDDTNTYDLEGNGLGLILGYTRSMGAWVVGGELAYSDLDIGQTDGDPFYFESFLDLKARAGYAVDNLLVYGTLGATITAWNEEDESFDGSGLLVGIGADYLVSPKVLVGAEYTYRSVTSEWNDLGSEFDADVGTFSLRVAYRF